MSEYRICVIHVDGSQSSQHALYWYSKNIHKDGDKAVLVYVPENHGFHHVSKWENTVYGLSRGTIENVTCDEHDQIKSDLLKFAEKLLHLGIEGKVRSVAAAKPEEGILRVAEEENADMIVIGSRGKDILHRTSIGCVSDYLLHHASCPVIVCKHLQNAGYEPCLEDPKYDFPCTGDGHFGDGTGVELVDEQI